jgi:hypothetical protein
VHQHTTRACLLGGLLLASGLAGCTPPLYRHIYRQTERRLACPCPAPQAVTYATQAVRAHYETPYFSAPTRLHLVRTNPDRPHGGRDGRGPGPDGNPRRRWPLGGAGGRGLCGRVYYGGPGDPVKAVLLEGQPSLSSGCILAGQACGV